MSDKTQLPKSWKVVPLPVAARINPPKGKIEATESQLAHFVPMACVREEFSGIDVSTIRPLTEVFKGYTFFQEGDVLFAKITPCMENGKLAVVPPLKLRWGFGSTEFHVLRATEIVLPKWIAHFVSQKSVRRDAKRSMTGSAGQLRVTALWLNEQELPIPPLNEQRRIVAKIEELFTELDAGVAALERAKANLKRYRVAVLKAAVEGKLTAEWRAKHPATEPASALLASILQERRQKWEADQLAKFAAAGKEPPKNWKAKYVEPTPPDTTGLPELPEGWCWASVEQLSDPHRPVSYGILKPGDYVESGIPMLRIVDLKDGEAVFDRVHKVSHQLSDEFSRTQLQGGEVLISLVGTIGRIGHVPHPTPTANIHRNLGMIAPMEVSCGRFLATALTSETCQKQIRHFSTGALQPLFNLADLKRVAIPVPQLLEQKQLVVEIAEKLSQIDAAETAIEHGLLRASRLRQSILKQAFEGKLVPQDPTDEPASVLLERLKATTTTPKSTRTTRRSNGVSRLAE